MDKTKLEMEFQDNVGKKFKISIDEPRMDLTDEEVKTSMEEIITRDVFHSTAGEDLAIAAGARFITTTTEELEI